MMIELLTTFSVSHVEAKMHPLVYEPISYSTMSAGGVGQKEE